MGKKYMNKGAFMTTLNRMIVADEAHPEAIADPELRKAVMDKLAVHLPVAPDKVLIRIEYVGVCGSDVHYFHEGQCGVFYLDEKRDIPYMLGHEAAGTIVEVGSAVKNLKVGDRVCCEPGKPCGKCEFCLSGKFLGNSSSPGLLYALCGILCRSLFQAAGLHEHQSRSHD